MRIVSYGHGVNQLPLLPVSISTRNICVLISDRLQPLPPPQPCSVPLAPYGSCLFLEQWKRSLRRFPRRVRDVYVAYRAIGNGPLRQH
jgi:hypothetical protein